METVVPCDETDETEAFLVKGRDDSGASEYPASFLDAVSENLLARGDLISGVSARMGEGEGVARFLENFMVKCEEKDVFRDKGDVEEELAGGRGLLVLAESDGLGRGSSLIGLMPEKEGRGASDGEGRSSMSLSSGLDATDGILRCSRHSLPSIKVSTVRGVVAGKRLARSLVKRRSRDCSRVSNASVRRSSSD